MAFQPIGIGTLANDGTGDSPRPAAIKINANLAELYKLYGPLTTPEEWGAQADGTTDDTTALNNAIASQRCVVLSNRPYLCGNVQMVSGGRIQGFGIKGYEGDNTSNSGDRPRLIAKGGVGTVLNIDGVRRFHIAGFQIDGNHVAGIRGISAGGTQGSLHHLTVLNCDYGAFGYGSASNNYSTVMEVSFCTFAACSVIGIAEMVDSNMVGGAVVSCGTGIYCGPGANTNNFSNVRVEWCNARGYDLYQCEAIQITAGLIDRCATNAIKCGDIRGMVNISNVQLRRNGKNGSSNPSDNCSIWLADNTNANCKINISGCSTETGRDDGGAGTLSPNYSLVYTGTNSARITLTGNDFDGYVTAAQNGSTGSAVKAQNNRGITNV
jgi:hypothetical protein